MTSPSGLRRGSNLPDPSRLPTLEVDPFVQPMERTPTGSTVLDEDAIKEHGRTFNHYRPDTYILPNDGDEQNRLDIQHKVQLLLLDGNLHKAPIQNPRRALDIGTGTGIWAIKFAQQYPDCQVIGSDLSLIQPVGIAPNCEFVREDAEDNWIQGTFDYIHARLFCAFVTDIRQVIQQAYDHLEPGGWLEFQEFTHEMFSSDDSLNGSALKTINSTWTAVLAESGRNPWAMTHLKAILSEVGFVDVAEQILILPIGNWPKDTRYKEVGRWNGVNCHMVVDASGKVLAKSGMTEGQIKHLMANAKAELRSGKIHAHQVYYVVYGRRPDA